MLILSLTVMFILLFFLLQFLSLQSVLLIAGTVWYFYRYIKRNASYFEDRSVKFLKPVPILGIIYNMVRRGEPMGVIIKEEYDKFKDSK